jgi:hypothetical protein
MGLCDSSPCSAKPPCTPDHIAYISGQLAYHCADVLSGIQNDVEEVLSQACAMKAKLIACLIIPLPPLSPTTGEFPYTAIEHPTSTHSATATLQRLVSPLSRHGTNTGARV